MTGYCAYMGCEHEDGRCIRCGIFEEDDHRIEGES